MIQLIQTVITKFLALAENIFNLIFGDVQFSVLWNWLPSDIQSVASSLIIILFAIAMISFIRKFLPF